MEMNEPPLKLGRITRKVEEVLELRLTSDVSIYMDAYEVNRLATHRPHDYLKVLESVGRLLRRPDFVLITPDQKKIVYARVYRKEDTFRTVYLGVQSRGKPEKWMLEYVEFDEPKRAKIDGEGILFRRVLRGKRGKKS